MKHSIIFMGLLMVSSVVLAGGSIFGGHKTRTSNPEGVSSIGIHICGSLNCPDVILQTGDCFTVPNATVKYGVCVCDDGYRAEGEKCTKIEKCTEEEKVEKSFYYGACCTTEVKEKFCPDEEPPACIKMDEVACSATTEEECALTTGTWECCYEHDYDPSLPCICAPTGAKVEVGWCGIIACQANEGAECSEGRECACGPNEHAVACNADGNNCLVCKPDEWAKCSGGGNCACGSAEHAVACNEYGDNCRICPSDEWAKCSRWYECVCGLNEHTVACNEYGDNCIACESDEWAKCAGGGDCVCGPNEHAVACNEWGGSCLICPSDEWAKCAGDGECVCGPNEHAVKCNYGNCATCEANQTATCDGDWGPCTCT